MGLFARAANVQATNRNGPSTPVLKAIYHRAISLSLNEPRS